MIAIPHAECGRCRELVPVLKMALLFSPEDPPVPMIAEHDRIQRFARIDDDGILSTMDCRSRCDGSGQEVPS